MNLEEFLLARLAEDEAVARAASGGTVEGGYGNWTPVSSGDEWEPNVSRDGDVELLVALRKGLPRPPDVMGGYWGLVTGWADDGYGLDIEDYGKAVSPHIARWDPARVLAECEAKRQIAEWLAAQHREHFAPFEREWEWCPAALPAPLGDLPGGPGAACTCAASWPDYKRAPMLKVLAQPYADHPDYDPAWR